VTADDEGGVRETGRRLIRRSTARQGTERRQAAWGRAITIGAPPEDVWAWLVQIGQGRGGFYSFDALENLARCDIHSADRIIPQLQELHADDLMLLAPAEAPSYRVATADPPHILALAGADPRTRAVRLHRPPRKRWPARGSGWVLRPTDGGRGPRLVAQQRYSYPRRQSVLWHLVEPVDFVMERRMLNRIKARAEAHPRGRDEQRETAQRIEYTVPDHPPGHGRLLKRPVTSPV
jgi:hypothetical protein